uniref:Uncharacterized protein n=1 Tax=viral metagenome TaxID=1070528 RepID=A0A6C0F0J3_9ZZZZ
MKKIEIKNNRKNNTNINKIDYYIANMNYY